MGFIRQTQGNFSSRIQTNQNGPNEPVVETIPAKSSWIMAFEYDPVNMRLTTHFKNGSIYQHAFFLPIAWNELRDAQNHSLFWARNVKGKYIGSHVRVVKSPRSELRHRGK